MKTAYRPTNVAAAAAARGESPFGITDPLTFTGRAGPKQLELISSLYEVWDHMRKGEPCELVTEDGVRIASVTADGFAIHDCLTVAFAVFDKVISAHARMAAHEVMAVLEQNLQKNIAAAEAARANASPPAMEPAKEPPAG